MMLNEVTSETPEERLEELGLELPPVPEAVADYVTHTVCRVAVNTVITDVV